jgi:hypothetical protein
MSGSLGSQHVFLKLTALVVRLKFLKVKSSRISKEKILTLLKTIV